METDRSEHRVRLNKQLIRDRWSPLPGRASYDSSAFRLRPAVPGSIDQAEIIRRGKRRINVVLRSPSVGQSWTILRSCPTVYKSRTPTLQPIDLATQTTFAELIQRTLDADFDEQFPEKGAFRRKKSKDRFYWQFQWRDGTAVKSRYVGPVTDKAITDRVTRFAQIKSDYKGRRELIRSLAAAGLPVPDRLSGDVIEAMGRAGFFRLRGVLVGTLAYQAYAGILGVRLGARQLMTQDADFAQFWGVSENVGDAMKAPLEILKAVDDTFRALPHTGDPFISTQYRNSSAYRVDFLTPNRGSDDHLGKPAKMKALGGAGAEPLRHLDFLIHRPERSVLLHGGGVPVVVPRAEHFAVHKVIVAVERRDTAKSDKDTAQADTLIQVLAKRRPLELAEAWKTAWDTGERWRDKLEKGRARLTNDAQQALDMVADKLAASRKRRGRS